MVFLVYGVQCHFQKYFSYIVAVEYPVKTTNLSHITDKLYHIMLYRVHLTTSGVELTKLVVIGTDCAGSCNSNYHTVLAVLDLNATHNTTRKTKMMSNTDFTKKHGGVPKCSQRARNTFSL